MNLVVVMAYDSPWSRHIVQRLAENEHRVVVVGVKSSLPSDAPADPSQECVPEQFGGQDIMAYPVVLGPSIRCGPKAVQIMRALRRVVRDCGTDMVLTLYGGNLALAAWLSHLRPYAVYIVGSDVLLVHGFKRVLTRIVLNAARGVFVNGEYLARQTRILAPRAPIQTLLIGIDTEGFSPLEKPPLPVRIVCTRAFQPVYNNQALIDALHLMDGLDVDFRVTFTSVGPLLDRVRYSSEKKLSPDMKRRVEFLGGVSDEALRETVRQSHIYVSMSLSDGTSTSLLEAMACGAFPIVSDIPQNREWIDPGAGNGILVPPRSAEALAEALKRAVGDPALRERAAGPNRARVLERASSLLNLKKLSHILESIGRQG